MTLSHRLALAHLVLSVAAVAPAAAQDVVPGQVVEKVSCTRNAAQSYALYLPSGYSADRKWPILYAFDPRARGVRPVQQYREAAERYGYIVAGSNNSRNGPVAPSDAALQAMLVDTQSRFSVDPARTYFTGFSGGARLAVLAGLALASRAAGVIGSGAGFPTGVPPSASVGFPYYATVGVDDFNYPEMKELDETLTKLGVRHRLDVFEGGHEWPPVKVCVRALEWMELQAMRTKARPQDSALLDQLLASAAAEAAGEEKAGRLYWAHALYAALAADFSGLRDVAPYEQKARELAASREVRRAIAEVSRSVELQRAAEVNIMRLTEQAVGGDDEGSASFQVISAVASLKAQAERPANDATRMAARRARVTAWSFMNDAVARDFDSGNLARATARLALMARIRPTDPSVDYELARVQARGGNRKGALQALQSAVKKGFNDAAAIEVDRAFDPLRADDTFQKIVAGLNK